MAKARMAKAKRKASVKRKTRVGVRKPKVMETAPATAPETARVATAADLGLGSGDPEKAPEVVVRTPPEKPPKGPESVEEILAYLRPIFPEESSGALLKVTEALLRVYLPKVSFVVPLQITKEQRSIVNHMIQRATDEGKNLFVWDYYEAMIRAGAV